MITHRTYSQTHQNARVRPEMLSGQAQPDQGHIRNEPQKALALTPYVGGIAPSGSVAVGIPSPDSRTRTDIHQTHGFKRVLACLLLATSLVLGSLTAATAATASASSLTPTGSWLSGGSGDEVTDGTFGAWRGTPARVATTWSDISPAAQVNLWQFDVGNAFANWTGSVDLAVGAIFSGESWAAAASGAYDARWSQTLSHAKAIWTSKQRGTLYIRFAHEMNGDWYPWAVHPADIGNFKAAWVRFFNLKQSIFPSAKLVFGTNGNTAGSNMGYDWRTIWPGDPYVDVYSVDWYSNHWIGNPTVDGYGAPMGLLQHQQFAQQHGKPMGISEWGNNSQVGDQPNYIQYMHDFFVTHGGSGAGQVLYESLFNVHQNSNQFGLFPETATLAPNAAAKYRSLF